MTYNTIFLYKINPLRKLQKDMEAFLEKWQRRGVFDCDDSFDNIELNLHNTVLPRGYALIKIHKPNNPIRIIVWAIDSPTYLFDKSISKLLTKFIPKPDSYRKNSSEIKSSIDSLVVPTERI